MALQTSGSISLNELQNFYGGSSPASLSEYYKNGSYVPSTKSTTSYTYGVFPNGTTTATATVGWFYRVSSNYVTVEYSPVNTTAGGNPTSITYGAYTFTRTTSYYTRTWDGSQYQEAYIMSSVAVTSSTSVNTSVPTSGAISLSNFYGGDK